MHKKLEADLISLAHSILKMKNKDDVFAMKEISRDVYERLSMLAFVEEYVNTTPNLKETKEELIEKVVNAIEERDFTPKVEEAHEEKIVSKPQEASLDEPETIKEIEVFAQEDKIVQEIEKKVEKAIEQPFQELEEILFSEPEKKPEEKAKVVGDRKAHHTIEEELEDTISVDVIANLFDNIQPKSLNDKLSKNIQIGLNDRIAFVKKLFNNDQENYNRVISQLNTFKTEKEAKRFINKMVKPEYNWAEYEDVEHRFFEIIERKFS